MPQCPVQASKAGATSAPHAARASNLDAWRARLGVSAAAALAFAAVASAAGWRALMLPFLFVLTLVVSQLMWLNLTIARMDSAFRRDGRPLRIELSAPGQRPRRLSPHCRGKSIYIVEALAALATNLAAVLIGVHMFMPPPQAMVYVACPSIFVVGALVILFPKMGGR